MKKTLITAITTALVVGAASTTFAAANPFSDVPSDHWSYDAVSKLAKDGVIDGYGDGTYRGDQKITRYEMAQMVAKAMTKSDVSAADKAMIDKLAAEYADELNNLGVRVSNLEKKSDNVKFTGLMRLDAKRYNEAYQGDKTVNGTGLLRLDINAAVNDNWAVKARLDGQTSLNQDKALNGEDKVTLKRIYAEGPLFGADAKVGKFGAFDSDNLTNGGLIIDTDLTGAEFIFGKTLKTKVTYGRLDTEDIANIGYSTSAADYAAIQFGYTAGKVALGAGYTHLKDNASGDYTGFKDNYGDTKVGIWNVGFDYALNKDFTIGGEYAKSNADASTVGLDSNEEKAYSAQLTYKGAKSDVAGSYGLWAAYRSIGELATIAPTYDGAEAGLKGYELGVNYMLDKNIMTKVVYFDGSEITSDTDIKKVFGRLEFAF